MKRPLVLFLSACVLSASSWADDQSLEQLHQLRTRSLLLCANALVQFNEYEERGDTLRPEAYRADLAEMKQISASSKLPSELALVSEMEQQIAELEGLPRQGTNRYGHGLAKLLDLQQQLEQLASKRYQSMEGSEPNQRRALRTISLDTGRMLLLYQSRAFVLLPKHGLDISEETNQQLDGHISVGLQNLIQMNASLATRLVPVERRYQFVRGKLMNFQQNWAPSGVALYLERNIRELDQLASDSNN
ncbi:hypothetical protein [Metapseudomonas resinovorans]|uniref:hypothetical protein n=1 Tax=Metapseudomonas resinovorans TaxID=53412 RepID=UPI0003F634B0|nr:hypothetical protein [Pseudomonas resinovorans]